MLIFDHSKGNGQCSLFFNICYLIVSWENIVTAFVWVKDLWKEVPENADAPVQYFISVVIISQQLIPSSGSQVVKWCSYWGGGGPMQVIQEVQAHLPPHKDGVHQGTPRPSVDRHRAYNFPLLATSGDSAKWQFARVNYLQHSVNRYKLQ